MTVPAIARGVIDTPGDIWPRPHANCYWLVPGQLLAGEHPSSTASAASAARIDAILDAGVRQFVDLTAEAEEREPYPPILLARALSRDLRVAHRRFAIVDFGVPSAALMRSALDAIYGALAAHEAIYLHCWGGVGRTGTVVGCLLREQGFTAREALDILERKWEVMEKRTRHPRSPETGGQIEFIERWPGG